MDQPFHCLCKTERCLSTIQGAKHIEQSILDGCAPAPFPSPRLAANNPPPGRYFVNDHILAMKALQREEAQQE